jgi:polysaccharide export outer membrane protein
MRRLGRVLLLAVMVCTSACSWVRGEEVIPGSVTSAPDQYQVGPNDVLSIVVWKQPDISAGQIPVRPDGRISLPLAGEIEVSGLTARQIKEVVTERLKEYVTEPNVTVMVLQVNYPVVYVVGEVTRPGPVPIRQDTTVLQLISMAGGFTSFADRDDVKILRRDKGKEYRLNFDYDAVVKGKRPEQNVIVRPGDVIVVED